MTRFLQGLSAKSRRTDPDINSFKGLCEAFISHYIYHCNPKKDVASLFENASGTTLHASVSR
ncbi:hypothetical protein QJS10_CPB13g01125 [Acorus calamus]|uniref:Uncharacterized protein n=1 Tax=Acorus calamus TaxID=4465 RepID=A0AAV9DHR1_ACOCL|nr:hypothetical protein QJS10_CPB13g01125 [Acorus calamus]